MPAWLHGSANRINFFDSNRIKNPTYSHDDHKLPVVGYVDAQYTVVSMWCTLFIRKSKTIKICSGSRKYTKSYRRKSYRYRRRPILWTYAFRELCKKEKEKKQNKPKIHKINFGNDIKLKDGQWDLTSHAPFVTPLNDNKHYITMSDFKDVYYLNQKYQCARNLSLKQMCNLWKNFKIDISKSESLDIQTGQVKYFVFPASVFIIYKLAKPHYSWSLSNGECVSRFSKESWDCVVKFGFDTVRNTILLEDIICKTLTFTNKEYLFHDDKKCNTITVFFPGSVDILTARLITAWRKHNICATYFRKELFTLTIN